MNSGIIRLSNVTRYYELGISRIYALKNVDLTVEKGEFLIVLGPSGSGKTTLLNVIGGIDKPNEGSVIVDGIDLTALDEDDLIEYRRKYVGFIFQFFNLIPTLTAYENVALAAELVDNPLDPKEVLEEVGLGDKLDHLPSQLSGGEQQRVAIARALVKDPPILLCDEPTGELDFETGRRILKTLKEVNERHGKTIVLVTHNTPISMIGDRVIRLRSGEIVDEYIVEEKKDPLEIVW